MNQFGNYIIFRLTGKIIEDYIQNMTIKLFTKHKIWNFFFILNLLRILAMDSIEILLFYSQGLIFIYEYSFSLMNKFANNTLQNRGYNLYALQVNTDELKLKLN
jgi:hypothetical protein